LLPHNKFIEELIAIGKTRWKGVRTKWTLVSILGRSV
jgi:hypothetical protein